MPATTVKHIIFKIGVDNKEAQKAMQESKSSFDKLLAAGQKFADFLIDATKNYAQYENALSHARRTMGLSRQETLELGDALMDLSTNFEEGGLAAGVTADELAKISGILGQLGFATQDNVQSFGNLVATVAKVGVAFGMSNQKAAEGLGILRNLYDLPVEKIENAASSIAYLGNSTVATAGQIMDIMTRMGGIAGLLGVSAQEAAALGATLRESGVSAQVSGTAMSQIFSRLASDVDRFAEVLKAGGISGEMLRMKIETGDATGALKDVLQALQNIQTVEGKIAATQALKDLGLSGVRVQQSLLALSNNLGGLNKNLAASEEAYQENMAVNDAYQAAIDNTQQKMTQFQNLLDIVMKFIGKDLSLAFSDFLEKHLIPFTEHFVEWLKTSEGAKAIFGRDGLIASGLDWIGTKLTENEDAFFSWLDTLDKIIPPFIESVKQGFKDWFDSLDLDFRSAQETFEEFKQWLRDLEALVKQIQEAWDILIQTIRGSLQTLENIGSFLQPIFQTFTDIAEGVNRPAEAFIEMPDELYKTNDALNEFVNGVQAAEQAGQAMGNTFLYHSVLPDMAEATIDLTRRTLEMGDAYSAATGHTRELYQTGQNTWTNLKREIDDTMTAWELQDGYTMNRQADLQFHLTQTADAITRLGTKYNEVGEETEKATEAAQRYAIITHDIWRDVQELENTSGAFVQQALAGNEQALSNIGNFGNLSSNQLYNLQQSGIFSASGTQEAERLRRMQGADESRAMNATFIFGDQEIGNMYAVLKDREQQEQRRSFGV